MARFLASQWELGLGHLNRTVPKAKSVHGLGCVYLQKKKEKYALLARIRVIC